MVNRFSWTKENDQKLRALREAGQSFDAIAKEFGVTRNSIAGRAHRLNIPGIVRNNPVKKKNLPILKEVQVVLENPPKIKSPAIATSIDELTSNQCKWPIGEVGKRGFHFCSATREEGKPYCDTHTNIAYVKPRTGVTKLWRK